MLGSKWTEVRRSDRRTAMQSNNCVIVAVSNHITRNTQRFISHLHLAFPLLDPCRNLCNITITINNNGHTGILSVATFKMFFAWFQRIHAALKITNNLRSVTFKCCCTQITITSKSHSTLNTNIAETNSTCRPRALFTITTPFTTCGVHFIVCWLNGPQQKVLQIVDVTDFFTIHFSLQSQWESDRSN